MGGGEFRSLLFHHLEPCHYFHCYLIFPSNLFPQESFTFNKWNLIASDAQIKNFCKFFCISSIFFLLILLSPNSPMSCLTDLFTVPKIDQLCRPPPPLRTFAFPIPSVLPLDNIHDLLPCLLPVIIPMTLDL